MKAEVFKPAINFRLLEDPTLPDLEARRRMGTVQLKVNPTDRFIEVRSQGGL